MCPSSPPSAAPVLHLHNLLQDLAAFHAGSIFVNLGICFLKVKRIGGKKKSKKRKKRKRALKFERGQIVVIVR